MNVLDEILAERRKQIVKGYDAAHDDEHGPSMLARAAAAVAVDDVDLWPWENGWKDSRDLRERAIVAAALLVASAEAYDRARAEPSAQRTL